MYNAILKPAYTCMPSAVAHMIMALRSAHLPGDCHHVYGSLEEPGACPLCDAEVYLAAEEFGEAALVEHRWRHIEHLLLTCPGVPVPHGVGATGRALLRSDLLRATAADSSACRAVCEAFPGGAH